MNHLDSSVRVAVRIRPQIPREIIDMCRMCTQVTPGEPQVVLGADKAFTFDYVFNVEAMQPEVYSDCVDKLVNGALNGYNATVLAYGQTGSGKTFTMGTGFETGHIEDQEGIIPRAVRHIFSGIEDMHETSSDISLNAIQFSVAVQFMELYNEELFDLLDPYNKTKVYKIQEDLNGGISVIGATIKPINGAQDALRILQQGALARTTASTQMNSQSSRSHALFTILIRRQRVISAEECGIPEGDLETLTSKFHFVDLAGSERLKRTGATGERAREGISINCGLLALGNVISALGDKSKKATHIPYRDSKLTRLLQDSLGGNSQTLMIACVSPSDRDFMETLNTLKYANRARNIKNRVQINQDQNSRTISSLRREIANLQLELLEYKQGVRSIDSDGNTTITDTFHENSMLLADNKRLQQRLKALQETVNSLTERNVQLLSEKAVIGWDSAGTDATVKELIGGYIAEIEKLQAKLIESENMYQQIKKSTVFYKTDPSKTHIFEEPNSVINLAKKELEKERELFMSRSLVDVLDDPENNDDSDSDDDDDSDKAGEMQAELNDLSSDIELKTKLIEQLELSQQRMDIMKRQYEEKLSVLNCKIINTQRERDQVLSNLTGVEVINLKDDKVKKVRDEYEKKLAGMQKELRKLQYAQKEHLRQQREIQSQESKLRTLRNELSDLKSAKIKLMKKITSESSRHKEEENRKNREIAQLRKMSRKQQITIKSLQAQGMAKDQILKRRADQVTALKNSQQQKLSLKAAGRLQYKKNNVMANNQRHIRMRWDSIQRSINRVAHSKQAVIELERELERLLNERENLSKDLASVNQRRQRHDNIDFVSEEDTIIANLNYIQDNISQIQHSIMEFEEVKGSNDESKVLQSLMDDIKSIDEAKFLLEKLCSISISQACDVALIQSRLTEKETLLNEVKEDSSIQQQLLQHVLAQNANSNEIFTEQPPLSGDRPHLSHSTTTIHSNGTYDLNFEPTVDSECQIRSPLSSRSISPSCISSQPDSDNTKSLKMRRRTAQPQEMLFGNGRIEKDPVTRTVSQKEDVEQRFVPLSRIPSAPGSLREIIPPGLSRQNSSLTEGPSASYVKTFEALSPHVTRRMLNSYRSSTGADDDLSTAQSTQIPRFTRMTSREDNAGDVFSRLAIGTQNPVPDGVIREYKGKNKAGFPLQCTHVVEGHSNSVLSIRANKNIIYTASADRTVRIWDLERGSSSFDVLPHPGSVVAIEYDEQSNLLFSACGFFIRVWDSRYSNNKPIKILSSSGSILTGEAPTDSVQFGESPITALCMGSSGNLYSAAFDKVRIWELKSFSCQGKLASKHQAAVMCITSWNGLNNTDFVATGSKDHYVKVFEISSTGGTVLPLLDLEPPHYDGVQSLAVSNDALGADAELFSGSRDSGIKRWDLSTGELKQSLNNAHKGWVSGMAITGHILLTGCRGGILKLWNYKTCDSVAELKLDSAINDIVVNGNRIYTASNDGTVRLWRHWTTVQRQYSNDKN